MAQCTERVSHAGMFRSLPCSRKAVEDRNTTTGLFTKCKQHSKAAVQARWTKQNAASAAQNAANHKHWDADSARRGLVDAVDKLLQKFDTNIQLGADSPFILTDSHYMELHDLVVRAKQ